MVWARMALLEIPAARGAAQPDDEHGWDDPDREGDDDREDHGRGLGVLTKPTMLIIKRIRSRDFMGLCMTPPYGDRWQQNGRPSWMRVDLRRAETPPPIRVGTIAAGRRPAPGQYFHVRFGFQWAEPASSFVHGPRPDRVREPFFSPAAREGAKSGRRGSASLARRRSRPSPCWSAAPGRAGRASGKGRQHRSCR